ncbi:MAG: efflux RND transporter periplasmic adaptor subunit [Pyrinomonadaceae bacterium]|nr:efflux RND transporter periplasmic adaptor subunit [Pyrinomonadaceae bacterium]
MSLDDLNRGIKLYQTFGLAIVLILLTVVFGAACGKSEAKTEQEAGALEKEQNPVSVTTERAVAREVPSFIQATGSLVATESSDVSPQTSGQVVATPVGVGALVRKGDVIARLDDRDARLRVTQARTATAQAETAVRQAEARLGLSQNGTFTASTIPEVQSAAANYQQALAQLRLAEANEVRYRELVVTGDVATSVYDQFRTTRDVARAQVNAAKQTQDAALNTARQSNEAIKSAQSAVESARANEAIVQKTVADAIVRAPYTGYVSNRPIAVGEYVTPSSIVATILLTSTIKLQLQVREADVPLITPGMGVSLEVDAYKDRNFSGKISAVNPAIDPASRAATIEADVENTNNALRSGMFATARIVRQGGNQGVFVPQAAVLPDPNTESYRAFVIQDGIAKLRVVQIAQQDENGTVQIISGISADETVATSNLAQLYEGAKVQ